MHHLKSKEQIIIFRSAFVIFSLLQKNIEFDKIIDGETKDEAEEGEYSSIRCPKCSWQPKKQSLWYCSDCDAPEFFYAACGTAWNTFDTGGKCPGCAHQWRWTSCLSCTQWSLHKDWYVKAEKNKSNFSARNS